MICYTYHTTVFAFVNSIFLFSVKVHESIVIPLLGLYKNEKTQKSRVLLPAADTETTVIGAV